MAGNRTPGPLSLEPELDLDELFGSLEPRGPIGRAGSILSRPETPGSVGVNDHAGALAGERASTPLVTAQTARSGQITPAQFADRYHNVRVSYFHPGSGLADSITVDVHIYNNYGLSNRRANMNEKGVLVGRLRAELRRGLRLIGVEDQHRVQIANCFFGKAKPEDFSVALWYALRYQRTTPASLQAYCDRTAKLGVDCSGFVNAYFLEIGRITRAQNISTYERGTQRTRAEDIRALDVLVWQGGRYDHIAVVDHVIPNTDPVKMVVVESSGSKDGLAVSEYTVLSLRGSIFRVDRGAVVAGGTRISNVKILAV
jgi:hypothetical protein